MWERGPNKEKWWVGTLRAVTRTRRVSIEVPKFLYDNTAIPTLTYSYKRETWMMLERHNSKIRSVETSFLRGVYGITWID